MIASAVIFTVTEAVPEHPVPEVTVTLYVVETVGLTVGFCNEDVNPGGFEVHA
jgi:hypothetical protein